MNVTIEQHGDEAPHVDLPDGPVRVGDQVIVDGLSVKVVELHLTFLAVEWGDGHVGPVSYQVVSVPEIQQDRDSAGGSR